MIVRELITKLGIDFDESGADRAEKRVSQLSNLMKTAASVFAAGQVFGFFKDAVMAASEADQVYGKLQRNFGDYAQGVVDWSKEIAASTGASADDLRQMAGTLGSMLTPTLGFDREASSQVSKDMAELAVNIGALENVDPNEVAGRLRSALTGSVEAVDQYGIGLKQTALEEFALSEGITKSVKSMTVAEKTMLIYKKIMSDTRDRVGAATDELKEQSGQTLRLKASWHDFTIAVGDFVKGPALWLTRTLGDLLVTMQNVAGDTSKMGAALTILGGIMLAVGIPLLLPFIKLALILGAVYLVLEDVWTMFEGGKSVVGDFIDAIGGLGSQQKVVEWFRDTWKEIVGFFTGPTFINGVKATFRAIAEGATWATGKVRDLYHFGKDLHTFFSGGGTPGERRARAAASVGANPGIVNELPRPTPMGPPVAPMSGGGGKSGGAGLTFNVYGHVQSQDLEAARRAAESVQTGWGDIYSGTGAVNTTSVR